MRGLPARIKSRLAAAVTAGVLMALVLFVPDVGAAEDDEPRRLNVVATLFPQYDFARQIAGDKASVRLLLPPGAESHSFEPTPADMRAIANADVFIYTGPHMEPWAKRLADSAAVPAGVVVVDASDGIDLIDLDTGQKHEHDENGLDHVHGDGHDHNVDPHVWLNPAMAAAMAGNIVDAFAEKDPDNAESYYDNARTLDADLHKLDADFAARVEDLPRRLLVFGERFPFAYFFSRYGLKVESPFNSCVPGAEPGLRAVVDTINVVKKNAVKYIYVEAMTASRMADVISRETGAEVLYVDSLHNPPLEKQTAGATYQSIMRENMDAFAKGLE